MTIPGGRIRWLLVAASLASGLLIALLTIHLGGSVGRQAHRPLKNEQRKPAARVAADDRPAHHDRSLYEAKGLSVSTARTVAAELTARNPLAAHLDAELHIDPNDLAHPFQAAAASALSFTAGALLPLLAILPPPPPCGTDCISVCRPHRARPGRCPQRTHRRQRYPPRRPTGGHRRSAGLALTYGVGHLFGTAIG